MKKIWLLTTLLVGGLLLTGCNNQQYEEEFSEYWLLQWPNGTITLEDFKKEWNIINESEVDNWTGWKICSETPETACVPVILKENEILVTPHEYNEFIAEETDLTLLEPYYTDLKTFRKVTWLKEASPEYVQWELPGTYIFDAYTKFYKTKEEREAMVKEKLENQIIEEPEFTWYYFIAETPASNPVSTSFSISDPWNTPLRTWMVLNMPITGFNNWDIVKVYYWRDYEELEKFTDFHTPRRASKPYKTEIIWSLKDELFIPRDNSQYKLQTENIEEPIIKTRKWVCRLYDESFNETIYEYTYPDLWIRITTPECWDTVHEYDKSNGVLFRSWSTILSTNKWSADWFYEYLTPYTKDPNQSLEEIIKERHLNPWCELNPWTPIAFKDVEWIWYFVISPNGYSSAEPTRCYSDDEDDNIERWVLNIWYFEPANDKSRYYKLRLLDGCAPWPCTIFGKVETL